MWNYFEETSPWIHVLLLKYSYRYQRCTNYRFRNYIVPNWLESKKRIRCDTWMSAEYGNRSKIRFLTDFSFSFNHLAAVRVDTPIPSPMKIITFLATFSFLVNFWDLKSCSKLSWCQNSCPSWSLISSIESGDALSKKLENIAEQNVIQIMTRIVRDSISNTEQRFERVNFHNVIFGKTAIRNQLPNSIGLISKFHLFH